MKVLITGANGFLGRRLVASAMQAGLSVRAAVRPATDVAQLDWHGVEIVRADLRVKGHLPELVRGCDAVIHSAASVAGDLYDRLSGTVVATENLIAAMEKEGVQRMVLVSSYSVYDYGKLPPFGVLDENGPLRDIGTSIDSYAQAKIVQERVVRAAMQRGIQGTIVRPGVLFGPGNSWSSQLGIQVNERLWLRVGTFASLPLSYVDNCADALVACVQNSNTIGKTYNVLDDELVTQRTYTKRLAERQPRKPRIVPVPWLLLRGVAELGRLVNNTWFQGKAKIPQLLTVEGQDARGRPLRHRGDRLRKDTGWTPRYSLDEALRRTVAEEQGRRP